MTEILQAVQDEMDRVKMQVAGMIEDHSTIAEEDLEAFVTLRSEVLESSRTWGLAWNQASNFALQVAIKIRQIRAIISRKDGAPDLHGTTMTYRRLVENDIGTVLDGLKDHNGNGIPLDEFKSRVKKAGSDYKLNFWIAAELAVQADPKLAATKVQVTQVKTDDDGLPVKKDGVVVSETVEKTIAEVMQENPAGRTSPVEVPAVLLDAADEVFSTQVNAAGERLPGFSRKDLPKTFGRQAKPTAAERKAAKDAAKAKADSVANIVGTDGPQDDSSNVVPPDWSMFRRYLRQVSAAVVLPELHRAMTDLSDAYIGAPGKAAPKLKAEDRKAATELLAKIGTLIFETGSVVAAAPGASKTEKVAPVRWTDPTPAKIEAVLGKSNVPEPKTTEEVLQDLTGEAPAEPVKAAPRKRNRR